MPTSNEDPSRLDGADAFEARYREMFEHSIAGMYRSRGEGQLLDANQPMADLLGYASIDEVYADADQRESLLELVERDSLVRNIEIERLRERPDLPLLLISGYPPELSAGGGTFEVQDEFLAKPFGPQELVDRVREMLERHAPE